jgi:hypothetical protein
MPSTNLIKTAPLDQWEKIAQALLKENPTKLFQSEVKSVLIGLKEERSPKLYAKLQRLHDEIRPWRYR